MSLDSPSYHVKGLISWFCPWLLSLLTRDLGGLQFLGLKNYVVPMEGQLPHVLYFFLTIKYLIYGKMRCWE